MRARIALIAALLGASTAAFAGVNTWTGLGPDGGTVRQVVYHRTNPSIVYMIADAGFFRSADEGASWQEIKADFFNSPSDLDVDPTDQSRVYVVSASVPTLLVSTDAGVTFNPITSFPGVGNIYQLEVSADGQTLYATSESKTYRSPDRGATWEEHVAPGVGTVTWRLHVDPDDKNTLYAIAPNSNSTVAVYVTHDGAASWTQLTAATPAGYVYDFAFASGTTRIWLAGENGMYVSSDHGQHFSAVATPVLSGAAFRVSLNPADATNVFLSDGYGQLFRSVDEGAHWTKLSNNSIAGAMYTIAISPTQPAPHVLVGGSGGLSLSTTGGDAWTRRNTGFKGARVESLSANPTADRIYLTAMDSGVHYIAAGANTTTEANNAPLRGFTFAPSTFYVPAVVAQDGAPGQLFASLDFQIARSLDSGQTWSLTGFPSLPGVQARHMVSPPGNPLVLLAGTQAGPYRSGDGGNTWATASTGLPASAYTTVITFAPSDPLIAYAGVQRLTSPTSESFGVYRSNNAGLTWSPANTGISTLAVGALAVDPLDPQLVYASAGAKLWTSANGGNSWSEVTSWQTLMWGGVSALAVDPLHPQILYAAGGFTVARSIDRGGVWELLRDAKKLPFWLPWAMLPDPNRPHILYLGTEHSGVQQLTISPDLALDLADSPAGPLPIGVPVAWRYTVSNLGPFHATGVKLVLNVPAAQAVSVDTSAGTCATTAQTITCSLDVLRAGFNATATLHFTPPSTGPFAVAASVQADQPDAAAADNTLARTANVAQISDLSVTATGTASARVGEAVSYTLTVANAGPSVGTDVQVSYELASGLTPGTATSTSGTCSVAASQVTCNLGSLAVSASTVITVNATAATAGAQSSTASVTTSSADQTAANNAASASTTVTAQAANPPPASGPSGGGGGGGGGGWMSPLALLVLAIVSAYRACQARRLRWKDA